MIRVCLVEDQQLVRHGIRTLLSLAPDIEVVGEAADGEEGLAVIASTKPDVVLLDLRMPKLNGLELLRRLRERDALPPTLVLTTFDDDEMVFAAIRSGARGFLLKDVSLDRLTDAIRGLAEGGSCIQPAITERIMRAMESRQPEFESGLVVEQLSEREIEVLRLVAAGYSNREIADLLSISEGTVKNHTSSIFAKLGVRDRVRAVLKAIDLGLI
ncbi:MAG: response regulator transcription factor [Acidobacteria bacterium]|nr:response regulator transcription factor [Acidobacteriota bacterium]